MRFTQTQNRESKDGLALWLNVGQLKDSQVACLAAGSATKSVVDVSVDGSIQKRRSQPKAEQVRAKQSGSSEAKSFSCRRRWLVASALLPCWAIPNERLRDVPWLAEGQDVCIRYDRLPRIALSSGLGARRFRLLPRVLGHRRHQIGELEESSHRVEAHLCWL